MATLNLAPNWFFGYDIVFELIFAAVALAISLFARRVYKGTDQKPAFLLHLSFMMISLSYFIQSVLNFMILSKINENLPKFSILQSVIIFDTIALYSHIFLMAGGLVTLMFMTLRSNNSKALAILFITTMLSLIMSGNIVASYYVLSSIFLLFISWYYISNYFSNKQAKTLLTAFAFILLFFGNFYFFLAIDESVFYVVGHFLELAAYILILANLYLVLRK